MNGRCEQILENLNQLPTDSTIYRSSKSDCANGSVWGASPDGVQGGRSTRGVTEHVILFGSFSDTCAKAIVVFDLNELTNKEINSITFTFTEAVHTGKPWGDGCSHTNGLYWVWSSAVCHKPYPGELRYTLHDSQDCGGSDLFSRSESWKTMTTYNGTIKDETKTINISEITPISNSYLCLAFSLVDDTATETAHNFRIWVFSNMKIEATYSE